MVLLLHKNIQIQHLKCLSKLLVFKITIVVIDVQHVMEFNFSPTRVADATQILEWIKLT